MRRLSSGQSNPTVDALANQATLHHSLPGLVRALSYVMDLVAAFRATGTHLVVYRPKNRASAGQVGATPVSVRRRV